MILNAESKRANMLVQLYKKERVTVDELLSGYRTVSLIVIRLWQK